MHSNTVFPHFHYGPNVSSTSNPLSGVHNTSKIEGSPSEAVPPYGPMAPTPNIHYTGKGSHPLNASTWASGVADSLYQEGLEGTSAYDPAVAIYAPYLGTYFHHDLPPSAHEFLRPDMVQPALLYPLRPIDNTETDISSLSVPEEMEHQSIPEMTHMNRSPSLPPSALNYDALTAWSRPIHVLDHEDHYPLGLASNPIDHVSFHQIAVGTPEDAGATLEPWTADTSPTVVYETNLPPLLLPVPSNWRKIPQRQYTPRAGDTSFLQSQRVTFSVNGIPGFNMQRALDRVFVGLDGRDDPVLENANGPASCRLLFPGYPVNTRCNQIAVRNWKKDPAPIPKSKLSYEVAKRVRQYLDELVAIPIDQSADQQWTIGQGSMKFEKMYLVNISWVSKGSLQPEIWVEAGDA